MQLSPGVEVTVSVFHMLPMQRERTDSDGGREKEKEKNATAAKRNVKGYRKVSECGRI